MCSIDELKDYYPWTLWAEMEVFVKVSCVGTYEILVHTLKESLFIDPYLIDPVSISYSH